MKMKRLLTGVAVLAIGTLMAMPAMVAQTPTVKTDAPAPSVYGMSRAFDEAQGFVPVNAWKGTNSLQKEFVRDYIGLGKEASKLPKSMLEAVASDDETVINKFLKSHGLSMQLQKFAPGDFGAAAVLTIEGKWSGFKTKLKDAEKNEYPAVALGGVEFYQVPGHSEPVVRIYKSTEFSVYVTPWDGDDEGFNAIKMATKLTPTAKTSRHPKRYTQLVMPMVDMDRTVELEWLKGMNGNGFRVTQALAQTKLKLDENGFSVKEGFAFGASRSIPLSYTLDKPFLLWVQVDGLSYPVFAVKVDAKYWKNPNGSATK